MARTRWASVILSMAAVAAAREGMDELLPEIQEYCSRQPSEDRRFSPCEDLILMSEFRSGGHDGKSAIYAAAERFSEVDDQRSFSLRHLVLVLRPPRDRT